LISDDLIEKVSHLDGQTKDQQTIEQLNNIQLKAQENLSELNTLIEEEVKKTEKQISDVIEDVKGLDQQFTEDLDSLSEGSILSSSLKFVEGIMSNIQKKAGKEMSEIIEQIKEKISKGNGSLTNRLDEIKSIVELKNIPELQEIIEEISGSSNNNKKKLNDFLISLEKLVEAKIIERSTIKSFQKIEVSEFFKNLFKSKWETIINRTNLDSKIIKIKRDFLDFMYKEIYKFFENQYPVFRQNLRIFISKLTLSINNAKGLLNKGFAEMARILDDPNNFIYTLIKKPKEYVEDQLKLLPNLAKEYIENIQTEMNEKLEEYYKRFENNIVKMNEFIEERKDSIYNNYLNGIQKVLQKHVSKELPPRDLKLRNKWIKWIQNRKHIISTLSNIPREKLERCSSLEDIGDDFMCKTKNEDQSDNQKVEQTVHNNKTKPKHGNNNKKNQSKGQEVD